MATDITIEEPAVRTAVRFADFVTHRAPKLAHAAVLAVGQQAELRDVVVDVLKQAHRTWSRIGFDDEPDIWVFRQILERAPDGQGPVPALQALTRTERIVAVAHFVLRWNSATIGQVLGLTEIQVDRHLTVVLAQDQAHLQRSFLDLAAESTMALPSAQELGAEQRRATLKTRILAVSLALGILALGGTLIAKVNTAPELAQTVDPPTSVAEPVADIASPAAANSDTQATAGVAEPLLAGSPVATPAFITVDGNGGFVGAVSLPEEPQDDGRLVVMSTSTNGQEWEFAGRWPLGNQEEITRFERVGERYVAWVGRTPGTAMTDSIKIGTSTNLAQWIAFEIPVDEAPPGLFFRPEITDVAVSGGNIVVLLTTTIELDYGAFALVESSTCGSRISRLGVVVDLCNGGEFQAMTSEQVGVLPAPQQLLVSRAGSRFVAVPAPFGQETVVGLTSTNGQFGITNRAGQAFATSTNGVQWTSVNGAVRTPPLVRSSMANADGSIIGVSVGGAGPSLLFRAQDQQTQAVAVSDVIGQEPVSYSASVESGPAGWVIDLVQDNGTSWLIYSQDGVLWRLVDPPSEANGERNVYVGDDEVLIQIRAGTQQVLMRVPLDNTE